MMILKISGIVTKKQSKGDVEGCICELICKAFTTRNLLHFAHWSTHSASDHVALGDLYDSVVSDIDEIVEVYQGKFGLIDDLYTEAAKVPKDITKHVKDEASWVEENRTFISRGCTAIENLIDTLIGHYYRVIFKLENLH